MSEAQLGGVPVVRACITSFKTTEHDIAWVVSEMNALVSHLPVEKPRERADAGVEAYSLKGGKR
jgi:hypothetical protein